LKPGKYLTLIDGGQLARLMILYCVGCRVEETLEIKRVNEEFFE
jgi:restriction system protein